MGKFIVTPASERRMLFEKQLPDAETMLEDSKECNAGAAGGFEIGCDGREG